MSVGGSSDDKKDVGDDKPSWALDSERQYKLARGRQALRSPVPPAGRHHRDPEEHTASLSTKGN